MKNKILSLFVSFLLVLTLVPFASATTVDVSTWWNGYNIDMDDLEVMQRDVPEVFVGAKFTADSFPLKIVIFANDQVIRSKEYGSIDDFEPENLIYNGNYAYYKTFAIDTAGWDGDYQIKTVLVSDRYQETAEDSLNLKVTPLDAGNHAPKIISTPITEINEGEDYEYILEAVDEDTDALLYAFLDKPGNPAWIEGELIDNNHFRIYGTAPQEISDFSYHVEVQVKDEHQASTTQSFNILVKDLPPCQDSDGDGVCDDDETSPDLTLNPSGDQEITEEDTLNVQITTQDADSTSVQITAYEEKCLLNGWFCWNFPLPNQATITDNGDGTADFTFSPGYEFVQHPKNQKSFNVVVFASDNEDTTSDTKEKVTITVNDVNRDPTATSQRVRTDADTPVTVTLTGSDADKEDLDSLEFVLRSRPQHGTLDLNLPEVTYTPNPGFNDDVDDFTFVAIDQMNGLSQPAHVTIFVNKAPPVNTPPELAPIGDKTVQETKTLTFQITATDDDNDSLAFTIQNKPTGADFQDNSDGTADFTWTPTDQQAGDYPVTFIVSDGQDTDSETITITVTEFEIPVELPKLTKDWLKFKSIELWEEFLQPGDLIQLFVTLENEGELDLEDLTLRATIYDLGARSRTAGPFDLEEGDELQKRLFIELPYDSESGEYEIRITASNDDIKRTTHRIIVIE